MTDNNFVSIEPIKEDVRNFLYENQEIEITDADAYAKAGDIIKAVNNRIKAVEAKRLEYTRPLDESKRRIMADFQSITDPLEALVKELKQKMLAWYRVEQARADAEQKKIEEEAMAKAKAENVSEVTVPVVNTAMKTQRGTFATITVKKVWRWKVTDPDKVPDDFYSIDEDKIDAAVKLGSRYIAGVEIYQEEQAPSIR